MSIYLSSAKVNDWYVNTSPMTPIKFLQTIEDFQESAWGQFEVEYTWTKTAYIRHDETSFIFNQISQRDDSIIRRLIVDKNSILDITTIKKLEDPDYAGEVGKCYIIRSDPYIIRDLMNCIFLYDGTLHHAKDHPLYWDDRYYCYLEDEDGETYTHYF